MAGTSKGRKTSTARKTSSSQKAGKTLRLSPSVFVTILVVLAGLVYAWYLEKGDYEVPAAVTENFIEKDANLEIHYFNVGQGDCSLIVFGETAVLVDAGEKEMGEKVAGYLNELGIKKLDYVIATHPHSDHIGGLSEVINQFDIVKVIAPKITDALTPTSKTYTNFLTALKNKALKLTAAKAGEKYTLYYNSDLKDTENAKPALIEIISPIYPDYEKYDDLNDFSVVFKLTYNNTSFLFTGDASKPAEADIIESGADISSDVLKIPHHGSSSSSTGDFIDAVSPQIGIIQVGSDNTYNHPNEKVVKRYEKAGVTVYRNDIDGTVSVYSDGETIKTVKEK